MKDSRKSPISSPVEDVRDKTSEKTDTTILKNNPKIDRQLLEEYERLVADLKGVIPITQGADYNLAHPLAREKDISGTLIDFPSKDMPTDAYHLGKRVSADKKT